MNLGNLFFTLQAEMQICARRYMPYKDYRADERLLAGHGKRRFNGEIKNRRVLSSQKLQKRQ